MSRADVDAHRRAGRAPRFQMYYTLQTWAFGIVTGLAMVAVRYLLRADLLFANATCSQLPPWQTCMPQQAAVVGAGNSEACALVKGLTARLVIFGGV